MNFSSTDASICSGQNSPKVTLTSNVSNAKIIWSVDVPAGIGGVNELNGNFEISSQTLVNNTNVPLNVVYNAYAVVDDQTGCKGPLATYRVIVYPKPKVTNALLKQQICSGSSSTEVVLYSNVNNSKFSWTAIPSSSDVSGFIASGTGNIPIQTLVNRSSEVQKVIYTVEANINGCGGEPVKYEIAVYPTPIFTSSIATTVLCSGKTFSYLPASSTTGVMFKWERPAVAGISNPAASGSGIDAAGGISESLINTTIDPIEVTYIYEMSINGCSNGVKIPISVIVNPQVTANFGLLAVSGCSPFNLVVKNLNSRALQSTFTVDFGDGSPIAVYNDAKDITHVYENDTDVRKLFYINITTQNDCGESVSKKFEISVQPQTIFSKLVLNATQAYGCSPFMVDFTNCNQSTGANSFAWDFGDGSPVRYTKSINENLVHTYATAGKYTITLTAENGCSIIKSTQEITVYPTVAAKFEIDKPQNCVGTEFTFNNLSGTGFKVSWDFGDGTTSTETNPKHSYQLAGIKTVTLTATQIYPNGGSCTATFIKTLEVLPIPTANFTTNASTLNCGPFQLQVKVPSENAVNVAWDFGDSNSADNTAVGLSASHTYTKQGDYVVTAKAYNLQGCTSVTSQIVKITESPIALFEPSVSEVCGTTAVIKLKNLSTYNGSDMVSYKWWANGVLISQQKEPDYNFKVPVGATLPYQFLIKLEVSNLVGCKTIAEKIIQFNPFPKAIFAVTKVKGCAPFNLQIENLSEHADIYEWYLDGKLVSNDKKPDITLNNFGAISNLQLVAKNRYGCTESVQQVEVSTYPLLNAEFSVSEDVSCNGFLDVKITNKSIGAQTYTWDFGDGGPLYIGDQPSHNYGKAGVYLLKLTASNGFCTSVFSKTIVVSDAPKAAFLSSVKTGCNTLRVKFNNLSINSSAYIWDFGDGTFSNEESPEHQYVYNSAPYMVKLVAKNQYGCSDEVIQPNAIIVFSPPPLAVTIEPQKIIKVPNYSFNFKAVAAEDIIAYKWDFGDGSFSDKEEVHHKYERVGNYKVKLHITNANGCVNIIEDEVSILDVPGYLYIPNAFEPENLNGDLKIFKVKGAGLATYQLKIFNKWGQLIWQTNKLDDQGVPTEYWDGTDKGLLVPLGAYYWHAEATYINGGVWQGMKYANKTESKTGVIHLIR
ncbi:PKD domain-containing protein [Nubsella zeaxanthinifaciens]|uniref:PKD domain-containing protein n=1 Tax=Nubsella zeaxanthinifaciens TaxID=392412 RepID=UPI001300808B|nr:PKD domain-containing protein [Nubsella zeaxanthinifaciens]